MRVIHERVYESVYSLIHMRVYEALRLYTASYTLTYDPHTGYSV